MGCHETFEMTKELVQRAAAKGLSGSEFVALVCKHTALIPSDGTLRWIGRTVGGQIARVTKGELITMERGAGMEPGTLLPAVRETHLKAVTPQDVAVIYSEEYIRDIAKKEGIYKDGRHNGQEIYLLATKAVVTTDQLKAIRSKYQMACDTGDLRDWLYSAAMFKKDVDAEAKKATRDKHIELSKGLNEKVMDFAKDLIRRRIHRNATIYYAVAEAKNEKGRAIVQLLSHPNTDPKGLNVLINGIADLPDFSEAVRSRAASLAQEYSQEWARMGQEDGSYKRDNAVKQYENCLFENRTQIPIIEKEDIKKITWEAKDKASDGLSLCVLDRDELSKHADILSQSESIESYLESECPTWLTWMKWNRHKYGEYDSVGCFFMWLWKVCGIDWPDEMREMFYLVGGGRTGNSALAKAILRFLGGAGTAISSDSKSFHIAGYVDKRFGYIAENSDKRTSGNSLIKSISGGDAKVIDQKHQATYTAEIHLCILSLNNAFPKIDYFLDAEYTRTYVIETRRDDSVGSPLEGGVVVSRYVDEMYALLAYCQHLWNNHKTMNRDGLLEKPKDMEDLIRMRCSTTSSGYLAAFFEETAKTAEDKLKEYDLNSYIEAVIKYNTTGEPDKALKNQIRNTIESGLLSTRQRLPIKTYRERNGELKLWGPAAPTALHKVKKSASSEAQVSEQYPPVSPTVDFQFDL